MSADAPIALAIETASRQGSVAVRDAAGRVHDKRLVERRRHDDALMPTIEALCRDADVTPGELELIGVSLGPGGFTGVRVGVVTAKVLAETLGCRLVGVPTASVLAAASTPGGDDGEVLAVCLAAKAETVWTQTFSWDGTRWERSAEPSVVPVRELFEKHGPDRLIADGHFPQAGRDLAAQRGVVIEPPTYDARACLRLATELAAAGGVTPPVDLVPLYPREPEAVRAWRVRHKKPTS
jgi:tRNA threonylcarbamoyladenosine biosynthesis protein TsaB